MKYSSFFAFHFHEGIKKRFAYKHQDQLYGYFHKYSLHVIQK